LDSTPTRDISGELGLLALGNPPVLAAFRGLLFLLCAFLDGD